MGLAFRKRVRARSVRGRVRCGRRLQRRLLWLLTSATALVAAACSNSPSSLDPKGPSASRIADLWWIMAGIAGVIFLLVVALLTYALLHRRQPDETHFPGPASGHVFILAGGVVLPVVVLSVLMTLTIKSLKDETASHPADLAVQVIAHDWWWEVRYPQSGVVTANEIHVPAGRRVQISGDAADVIHSFWVPQLIGKYDLIPGQTHTFTVEADRPGVYRGQCAEYCGLQHANMAFVIVAESDADFAAWLSRQAQPLVASADPAVQRGLQVFLGSSCAACHTVRGTAATATSGPDLTHVASRSRIGAGTLETTPGNFARWVTETQSVKPGVNMPSTDLDPTALDALVAFLVSLK
ncbi:MAG: cytochrome c oxidase subunit II [Dehalococcoidia bacterium]|nr:cytochrome c oxidase subunit II [Dehalococcoidia bacterium]